MPRRRRALLDLVLVAYVAAGVVLVVVADAGAVIAWLAASVAGDPPSDLALAAADAAVNIVLAIPLGVLVTLRWPALPPAAVIVAGMCLSAAAETVQLLFLDERAAQLTDVAANTLGTTVGVLVAVVARRDRPDA